MAKPVRAARPEQGSRRSARRRAREFALQGLYQWQLARGEAQAIAQQLAEATGFDKVDAEYFRELLFGAIGAVAELDQALEPLIDRKLAELSPVEHAILLLAGFELSKRLEVPYRVVINEAVELAKAYGGTDGHKFVNGVLDKLAPSLRPAETAGR